MGSRYDEGDKMKAGFVKPALKIGNVRCIVEGPINCRCTENVTKIHQGQSLECWSNVSQLRCD